jgi:uncharacterized protein YbjT (DUF2867 family)
MKDWFMTNGISSDHVLVLGGTGKSGRRIVERLAASHVKVRVGSRSAAVPFDWEEPATWGPALDSVDAVYVSFQPDLAVPGALETVTAFFRQVEASGVRKLVLLSGRGEVEAEDAERALQACGIDWTILRASWFNQNFSENFFLEPLQAGEVVVPTGLAAEPFVDVEDIADVAFAALTGPGHSSHLYELTGPSAVTFGEAVRQIAAATRREIAFIEVPPLAYREALDAMGMPRGDVDLVMYLFTTVLDGRNTVTANGVERALGRPARAFSAYVRETAATGVWSADHD